MKKNTYKQTLAAAAALVMTAGLASAGEFEQIERREGLQSGGSGYRVDTGRKYETLSFNPATAGQSLGGNQEIERRDGVRTGGTEFRMFRTRKYETIQQPVGGLVEIERVHPFETAGAGPAGGLWDVLANILGN